MKKMLVTLCLFLLLPSLSACLEGTVTGATQQLRLAHSKTSSHPAHLSLEYFVDMVFEETNGEVDIQLYPSEQLGSEAETIELMQAGAIDFVQVGAGNLEQFVEAYSIFSLPYLFDNEAHFHSVMDSDIASTFYQATEDIGFIGLTYYDAGARSFYTNRPIETLNDLRGLKIRVQASETILAMIRHFGGAATSMSYGEVYTGLQQGIIDGAENSELNLISTGHVDTISDFSTTEHIIAPDMLTVSNTTWNKFTKEQKEIIKKAAIESTELHKEIWEKETELAIEEAKNRGVAIHYPDKEPFMKAVQPLHDIYSNKEETKQIYKEIRDRLNK